MLFMVTNNEEKRKEALEIWGKPGWSVVPEGFQDPSGNFVEDLEFFTILLTELKLRAHFAAKDAKKINFAGMKLHKDGDLQHHLHGHGH